MEQSFHRFQREHPTVTSSPREVRKWIEELGYSFLVYGEKFERAKINGERLLNITQEKLNELGIIRPDHKDIILKAIASVCKENKVAEQVMQGKDQSDLSHEMESDIIDVCKSMTKICHYIIALPPDVTGSETEVQEFVTTEEKPPRVQVPVTIETEVMSFPTEHGPALMPTTQYSSMAITTTSSSSELTFTFQDISLQSERVPYRCEYFSLERLNTSSNKRTVILQHDDESKSETEVSDTKGSEISAVSLEFKSLQDLRIIESDTPPLDSGSERCLIDSDSDRGIGSDSGLEQHSKDLDSIIWGADSDMEKCLRDSDSAKHLLEGEKHQMASGSVEQLIELKQYMVRVEQHQGDSDSLKYCVGSGSEKCLEDSDSDRYLMDSDNERLEMESDSDKFAMASASVKHLTKAEKRQMASESIKRLIESENRLMETNNVWIISSSERYVVDSDTERGGIASASESSIYLLAEEKHQEETRSKRYMMASDSVLCRMDSGTERYGLASTTMKCLLDAESLQLSTDTEGLWIDSSSERNTADIESQSQKIGSDFVRVVIKDENLQISDLEEFSKDLRSESESCCMDSEREHLVSDQSSSNRHQLRSVRQKDSSGRFQHDIQKHPDKVESHEIDSNSKKLRKDSENKEYQDESESGRYLIEMQKEPCLQQFESERLQMKKRRERHSTDSDSEKEYSLAICSERQHLDSENEAQRLGARRKDNRPKGFWRPIFLPSSLGRGKKTEEHSVQKTGNRVSRSQPVRYLSDDKFVRFKEMSPTVSDNQKSQQMLKEMHSHNLSSEPFTLKDNKHHRNASRKISVYRSHNKDYRYTQSFQSSASSVNTIHLLSTEAYTSDISVPDNQPISISPRSVLRSTTQRNNTHICPKCFMEISDYPYHKCVTNSDDDSFSDCPLHLQVSLESKYSLNLNPKSDRHHKTSCSSPLSPSLEPRHHVDICCPPHREDSIYSVDSISYLHYESHSAVQNLMDSTQISPMNPPDTMDCHNLPGPDRIISASSATGLESEGKFNLTGEPPNEAIPDNETKLVSTGNLKDKASTEKKLLPKGQIDHDDETGTENETDDDEDDDDDETDPENEDNTEDKKDPKDKSDPDDSDPKDSNGENDADTDSGSDPSGDAGRTNESNSSNDGDPNNGTDPNSEPDPNTDNATNNDADSKYSTDAEEDTYTSSSDYSFGLDNIDCDNTSSSNDGTNPNYNSEQQSETGKDCTSDSDSDAGPSNDSWPGHEIFCNIGPLPQNVRLTHNSLDSNNTGFDPNNSPSPPKDLDSNYNERFSNATSHNSAIYLNIDADPNYSTRPTSAAGHNCAATPDYNSDEDYVPGFTHAVGSSFVVNPNYISRTNYVTRLSSTASTSNATDTSNTTNYSSAISPSYSAGTNIASYINHIPKFSHFIGSNFVINPNYIAINTHNAHSSTNTSNFNNLLEPNLEINSSSSISNTVDGNSHTFSTSANYSSTPKNLTSSKLYGTSNYTIFSDHKFCTHLKDPADSVDSASFKHTTRSKDALDARESGFCTDISKVQNPIGIKDLANLKIHPNPNIPLPNFDIIVEAEPPDVVKFAISSGAVKQFFKLLNDYGGGVRAEGEPLRRPMEGTTRRPPEGPVWKSADPPAWGPVRPIRGRAVSPERRHADRPARGRTLSPMRGFSPNPTRLHAERHARGRGMSPTRAIAVSPPRGYIVSRAASPARGQAEKHSRGRKRVRAMTKSHPRGHTHAVSPASRSAPNPARGHARGRTASPIRARAVSPATGHAERHARRRTVSPLRRHAGYAVGLARRPPMQEVILGAAVGLTVKSAEGYDEEASRSAKQSKKSTTDKDENENESSILKDTKADGFIYLPEFRIDLAPHCRRNHAFQATHARIKNFYFAAECSDEMNYWVGQMLQLAYGSSFGDAAANAEYRRIGAMIYAKCVLALKREFPVIWCTNCYEATTIVSVNPNFQYRRAQNISDEFIYFRPIDADIREEARRQKQQKSTLASRQHNREEYSRPGTPRNLWLESPENAESPGSDDLEVARNMYPFRERSIFRRSWAELLEAPLNSEGLHILQTVPTEEDREIGYHLQPEGENQAITPPKGHHPHGLEGPFPLLPQQPKPRRQRSHSLPRYSDVKSRNLNAPELTLNPEETCFCFPTDHNPLIGENAKERDSIEEAWQKAILSGSGEHPPINPSFENSSAMWGKTGISGNNAGLHSGNVRVSRNNISVPRVNVGVPMRNVGVPVDNVGVPLDYPAVPRGNGGVPMGNPEVLRGNGGVLRGSGTGVSMGNMETFRNNVGTSRRMAFSPLTELLKIGEHQL
uniref:SAM domain-containing protein n=1 Tax=Oryctolagus cuniculus TaxID=9986 RepID=A0A5F9C5D7_RABIT